MSKKATGIVSYITLIGWLIAFLAGDKEGAKFHLNQSLVLIITNIILIIVNAVLGNIPVLGVIIGIIVWICDIVLFVFWIMGLVHAIKEEEKELPLIGGIKILK